MGTTANPSEVIGDARHAFDGYLRLTSDWSEWTRRRLVPIETPKSWHYPEDTVQTDMMIFSTVFTRLWSALADRAEFARSYAGKKRAFDELAYVVTPNKSDPHRLAGQDGFWNQNAAGAFLPLPPTDEAGMYELGRTLRNGFNHFNFRFVDKTPEKYFRDMGLPLPSVIVEPTRNHNYRVFVCDWNTLTKGSFGDPGTNSRLVGTHFTHLRYHMFMFLARFLSEPGKPPYTDILTGQLVA
jgi:hypothetical protein